MQSESMFLLRKDSKPTGCPFSEAIASSTGLCMLAGALSNRSVLAERELKEFNCFIWDLKDTNFACS